MEDISGNWTGIIIYGEGYVTQKNEKLYFDLDVSQENEEIEGIATDLHGAGASPDPASLVGTFTGKSIEFIKQYVSSHYYANGKMYVDDTQLGPEIFYTGTFNEQSKTFEGTWSIKETITDWSGPTVRTAYGGDWRMARK